MITSVSRIALLVAVATFGALPAAPPARALIYADPVHSLGELTRASAVVVVGRLYDIGPLWPNVPEEPIGGGGCEMVYGSLSVEEILKGRLSESVRGVPTIAEYDCGSSTNRAVGLPRARALYFLRDMYADRRARGDEHAGMHTSPWRGLYQPKNRIVALDLGGVVVPWGSPGPRFIREWKGRPFADLVREVRRLVELPDTGSSLHHRLGETPFGRATTPGPADLLTFLAAVSIAAVFIRRLSRERGRTARSTGKRYTDAAMGRNGELS